MTEHRAAKSTSTSMDACADRLVYTSSMRASMNVGVVGDERMRYVHNHTNRTKLKLSENEKDNGKRPESTNRYNTIKPFNLPMRSNFESMIVMMLVIVKGQ